MFLFQEGYLLDLVSSIVDQTVVGYLCTNVVEGIESVIVSITYISIVYENVGFVSYSILIVALLVTMAVKFWLRPEISAFVGVS
jgi:hypothetical protein